MTKNKLKLHDHLTRSSLSNVKVAEEFFKTYLPPEIQEHLNWKSLAPQPESFINDKLRLEVADLLYAVTYQGRPGYLYLLLEHASVPDKKLPFRMLKYMIGVIENHLKKSTTEEFPFIYPVIFYTGTKPYPYTLDFFDLFGSHKDIARETFYGPCQLIDLTQVSDETLHQYQFFGAMALLLKHSRDPDILPLVKRMTNLFKNLARQGETNYIYTIVTYIAEATEIGDQEEFVKTMKQLDSVEDKVMTLAEIWKKQGFESGILKGKQLGIQEGEQMAEEKRRQREETIVLNLLGLGLERRKISEATGFSIEEIDAIAKKRH